MKKNKFIWLGLAIVALYILPAFIQPEFNDYGSIQKIRLAFPKVISGDEPAYIIATYSLAKDLDLDLKNNYDNSLNNSYEGGHNFKNQLVERHVRFILNNQDFTSNFTGFYNEVLPEYRNFDFSIFNQMPFHPSGLPLLIAIFLWPLKDSAYLEVMAVFLTIFISLIGMYLLYHTLLDYQKNRSAAFLITALIALGTTNWFYSKTFFPDPYLASFLLIAYYLFIVRKQIFLPAIFLGAGSLMKYPFIIFPGVFCLYLLSKRKVKEAIRFCCFLLPFGLGLLLLNYSLYGHLFSQGYRYGSIIEGLLGIPFSLTKGIFIFAPFLIFFLFGIPQFYKTYKDKALFTLALIFAYYVFIATFVGWWGGGFASRNMTPLLPLLAMPLYFWYIHIQNKTVKYLFYILAVLAIIINFQTAFFHFIFWNDKPPWQLFILIYYRLNEILYFCGFV